MLAGLIISGQRELLPGEDPEEVVVHREGHQEQEERESYALGDHHGLLAQRLPPDRLNGHEEDVSTVQDRNRQKVEYPQIDADHGGESEEVDCACRRLFLRHLKDHHGRQM